MGGEGISGNMCQRDLDSTKAPLKPLPHWHGEARSKIEEGLETIQIIILNTRNEKTRYYLQGSLPGLRQGLGWITDAEFEMATSLDDDEEEPEEEI